MNFPVMQECKKTCRKKVVGTKRGIGAILNLPKDKIFNAINIIQHSLYHNNGIRGKTGLLPGTPQTKQFFLIGVLTGTDKKNPPPSMFCKMKSRHISASLQIKGKIRMPIIFEADCDIRNGSMLHYLLIRYSHENQAIRMPCQQILKPFYSLVKYNMITDVNNIQ